MIESVAYGIENDREDRENRAKNNQLSGGYHI